ncbi:histidine kinase CKI1 [Argentina anserina]|uniref:histidine kinase CKI1 n=1 Tax=Argentina anserina TaxID=57926 RepID=UPI00217684F8|nr:histidine kinase CKI1 [Potentilla anserina]
MHRYATLIEQREKTEQAERKSMRKSDAFAKASHDIRAALAGIISWINFCKDDIHDALDIHATDGGTTRRSEIEMVLTKIDSNLKRLDVHAEDLLGILNSVLDKSKIEAGKMVLENEEFDVAQLVEEVVDLFLPTASMKGLDVVLDPCDGSVTKFARVRGDRGRLKQILNNLLSNAVKFTSEGQITVRAWVRKPSFKNSVTASHEQTTSFLKYFLCFFNYKTKNKDDKEAMNGSEWDPNSLEFFFEVDDTGRGILKERQKSVFEDYVQVKEKALGEGGTGLGLGIVQSLVRLMHGEIGIVDKEIGERGTCFRFNVLLSTIHACDDPIKAEPDIEMGVSENQTPVASPKPNARGTTASPKLEGSYVVLLINNAERRRVIQKFLERFGIKVSVAERWEQLARTLQNLKNRKGHSQHNSISGISDLSLQDCLIKSASCNSNFSFNRAKEMSLMSSMDGSTDNNVLPLFHKKSSSSNLRGASDRFVMLLIDTTAGPLSELCKIVNDYKRGLQNGWYCKVVWLSSPFSHANLSFNRDMLDGDDVIKHKPLHGTCLYEVVRLLPECGGALPKRSSGQVASKLVSTAPSSSKNPYIHTDDDNSSDQIVQESNSQTLRHQHSPSNVGSKSPSQSALADRDIKPLTGKKILVAEDTPSLRMVTMQALSRLGAAVKLCENGREALDLVRNDLLNQRKHVYDYILMDCQMPEMDGFEATREIRKEEKSYNVRIPIIALTAHAKGGEETRMMMEAGMDEHLEKTSIVTSLGETLAKIDSITKANR